MEIHINIPSTNRQPIVSQASAKRQPIVSQYSTFNILVFSNNPNI
jgi:hypothetical protein